MKTKLLLLCTIAFLQIFLAAEPGTAEKQGTATSGAERLVVFEIFTRAA